MADLRINLRGLTWDDPRGWGPLESVGQAFAASPAGRHVTVTWDVQPLEGFESRPIPDLARSYDLLNLDHPHLGEATATGSLQPLGELADHFVGPSLRSYRLHDQLWAVPVDAACQASAYHPGRLALPPVTFDEVLTLAQSQPVAASLTGLHALMALLTLLAQQGTPLADEAAAPWPDLDFFAPAADLLHRLAAACRPESLDWNPLQLLAAMGRGQADYAVFTFAYINAQHQGLRFAPVPGSGGAVLGGTGLAVSAHSRHPAAARAFARFAGSLEVQQTLWPVFGGQPAHRRAWDAFAATDAFFRDLRPTLDTAWIRPRYAGWIQRQSAAGTLVNRWLHTPRAHPRALHADLTTLWVSTAS